VGGFGWLDSVGRHKGREKEWECHVWLPLKKWVEDRNFFAMRFVENRFEKSQKLEMELLFPN